MNTCFQSSVHIIENDIEFFFKIATTGLSYKYNKELVWILWPSHFYRPLFCQRIHYLFNSALPIQFIGRIFFEYTRIGNTNQFKKDILLMNLSIILFLYWRCFSFYDAPCRELCVKKKLSLRISSTLKVKKKKIKDNLKRQ